MIQQWYEEVAETHPKHKFEDCEFVFYKGFKITKYYEEGEYVLEDVRFNDFYQPVSNKNLSIFKTQGFIKGIDNITFERDQKRMSRYKKKIEQLYQYRDEYRRLRNKDPKFYDKKIRNCMDNIHKYVDLFFFYKVRVNQHKQKYNLN